MKRTKIASFLMLTVVLALSVMSFVGPTPDFYCYSYTGPRPVTDAEVIKQTNYTQGALNTALTCGDEKVIWCGFCIETGSSYFDATAVDVKWTNANFKLLLQSGSPTEIYDDNSLDNSEVPDNAQAHSRVFAYFKPNN